VLPEATRQAMAQVAVRAAQAVGYVGAGTCEFLFSQATGDFYFLEMNTRLQVEHPITEMVTGVDLVHAQLRVARGEPLWFRQEDLTQSGHAIEMRVYAEDPGANWAPSPGPLTGYREPGGPWVRVDSGAYQGGEIPIHYDPMIAKLIVWGATRDEAIQRARRALLEYRVRGIRSSLPFFRALMDDPDFLAGNATTAFLSPERVARLTAATRNDTAATVAAAIAAFDRDTAPKRPAEASGADASRWKWSLR
jgi:acetyl/propionyl-CoA carboxylase alpha subunit